MQTTHTPGPWAITLDARNALGFVRPATPELSTPIATIHYADSGAPDANARLIASAPDLLAACVLFEDLTRNGAWPGSEDLAQLQAAIARATGAA